jgi:hypothetical protein
MFILPGLAWARAASQNMLLQDDVTNDDDDDDSVKDVKYCSYRQHEMHPKKINSKSILS